jgi:uncharacterized protein
MLADQIVADLKQAMLAKDVVRVSTLRMLKSALEYTKIEKKQETLADADVLAVLKKQVKQRQDSIAGFTQGGRADLVQKEQAELTPAQLEELVAAAIAEVGATTKADMGKVMKAVQTKTAGRADNRAISQIVAVKLA